jgi:hypothetical protein
LLASFSDVLGKAIFYWELCTKSGICLGISCINLWFCVDFCLFSVFCCGNCVQAVRSEHAKVVCFGELLIDFVPTVGGLALADAPAFKKAPGGAPANVAVGIARLGGNSAFVGKVSFVPETYHDLISLVCAVHGLFVI